MGWCSGGELFWDVCNEADKYIRGDNKFELFVRSTVNKFENADADTLFDDLDDSRTGKVMEKIARERGYFDD